MKLYSYKPQNRFDFVEELINATSSHLQRILTQLLDFYKGLTVQFIMPIHLYDPLHDRELDAFLATNMVRLYHSSDIEDLIVSKCSELILQLNAKNQGGIVIYYFNIVIKTNLYLWLKGQVGCWKGYTPLT